MKALEIRKFDTLELEHKAVELKEELFNLRFQLAVGQLDNTARIRQVKKMIAQIRTIITERELSQE